MSTSRPRHLRQVSIWAILCGSAGAGLSWWQDGMHGLDQLAVTPIAIGFAAGVLLPLGLSVCNVFWKRPLYQSMPMLVALIFNLLFDLSFVLALLIATFWARGQFTEFSQIGDFLLQAPVPSGLAALAILLFVHHSFNVVSIILGKGRLAMHLLGTRRYPHVLERFVLCVELVDPPAGTLDRNAPRYLGYLNDFLQILEESASEHDAELVGFTDRGAILVWPGQAGSANNQAIHLVNDLRQRIGRQETWYLVVYHTIPRFRATLDFGTVTSAELGWKRKVLATQGPALESAKRLMAASIKLKEDFCIGEAAMDRLILPAGSRIHRTVALGKPDQGTEPPRFYTLEQISRT